MGWSEGFAKKFGPGRVRDLAWETARRSEKDRPRLRRGRMEQVK